MNASLRPFKYELSPDALHIDYLRLRCGQEKKFAQAVDGKSIRAHIAFSEWDVVLFIPCSELYPPNLIEIYSNDKLAGAIAGSAGFYNYLWKHRINRNWQERILNRKKTISMLVSLRFTDTFRRKLGLGAELLFCSFLHSLLKQSAHSGVSAIVAHSVGWNDATILLDAKPGFEDQLVKTLTEIRYCKERDCDVDSDSNVRVVAATYSHVLGNLERYTDSKRPLRFNKFCAKVQSARLLVRINPDVEPGLREKLETLLKPLPARLDHKNAPISRIGSELGHYNFSADITEAFDEQNETAVSIIQGFRRIVGEHLTENRHTDEGSFPETTTEITFFEEKQDDSSSTGTTGTLSDEFRPVLERLLKTSPKNLLDARASMTAHRLAILLGTLITYLDDPVRGSVVGHLCRFLKVTFDDVQRLSDRAGREDLCHIMEYALHQATDGLTQFQHDANSLGLSGRGGYNRLIQAVEEFIDQVAGPFELRMVPLITFGLRPSNDGTTLQYWVDLPFSTAFVPERWYLAYHDVARMCWQRIFGWRLDSIRVWQRFEREVIALATHAHDDDRQEFVLGREVVEELFPSYLLLNVVCDGKPDMLDRLMVAKEFLTRPKPELIRSLTVRLVLHVLLRIHDDVYRGRRRLNHRRELASFDGSVSKDSADVRNRAVSLSFKWWRAWRVIHHFLARRPESSRRQIARLVEAAASSLRAALDSLKSAFNDVDAARTFDSTINLIATRTFKNDALEIVERVTHLLAIRGQDYVSRARISFEIFDPSAVDFGFILGRINKMRSTVHSGGRAKERYRRAIETGRVYAQGPRSPSLAYILTSTGEVCRSGEKRSERHPSMVSCLSSILALWHSAVTREASESRTHPPDLLATLDRLKLLGSRPY